MGTKGVRSADENFPSPQEATYYSAWGGKVERKREGGETQSRRGNISYILRRKKKIARGRSSRLNWIERKKCHRGNVRRKMVKTKATAI